MGRRVEFTVAGKPYGKKRPRVGYNQGLGRAVAFNPRENASYEETVAVMAARAVGDYPLEGPVRLTVTAIFAIPASWSKKRRSAAFSAPHIQKPDVDNITKAVADGCNRVAWGDDSQIAENIAVKRWAGEGEPECVKVTIEGISPAAA